MLIEIHGHEAMLVQIRLHFGDELQNAGYGVGPRIGQMEAGRFTCYVKEESIITVRITTEESEASEGSLRIESENEIPEMYSLWDAALVSYGRNIRENLLNFAHDKTKVENGIK